MWKPSIHTLITNTGNFLRVELTSPGSLKWKPAGDVSYNLTNVDFLWAFDSNGSAHSINGQKYPLEMIWNYEYQYELVVPSDLIAKRIDLHERYRRLETNDLFEEDKENLEKQLEDGEAEYEAKEDGVLKKRYIHSEAQEALHHRKPTSYNFGFKNVTVADGNGHSDDDDDDDVEIEAEEDKGDVIPEEINFYRQIKFKTERAVHEVAAKRFYPYYERHRTTKSSIGTELDIDEYIVVKPDSSNTSIFESAFDETMFPKERDKERERARRAKFREEQKRKNEEAEEKLLDWIRLHSVKIHLKLSTFFEVKEDGAPYYSLFSFLPRVTEPLSRVFVDGNLLAPFKSASEGTDFFAYAGSRLFQHDQDVIWVINKNPLPISNEQMWLLRNLKNEFGKLMEHTPLINRQEVTGPVFFNVLPPKREPLTCPGKHLCSCEENEPIEWKAF